MSGNALVAAPPREVLVVVTRRIGDVLLATPLVRSLRAAWPDTEIDALVFAGTEGVLAANPDIRRVLTVPERPTLKQHFALLRSVHRRYALALSLVPGDRPTLYAFVAGRRRAGLLVPGKKNAWKQRLLQAWAPFDDLNTHTVRMHLALADLLGVPRIAEVAVTWHAQDEAQLDAMLARAGDRPIAALHAYPKYRYKM
ncbi:MAG TPA: LPS core biosynthesis protein, partial [Burkholderiales bacterium]